MHFNKWRKKDKRSGKQVFVCQSSSHNQVSQNRTMREYIRHPQIKILIKRVNAKIRTVNCSILVLQHPVKPVKGVT